MIQFKDNPYTLQPFKTFGLMGIVKVLERSVSRAALQDSQWLLSPMIPASVCNAAPPYPASSGS